MRKIYLELELCCFDYSTVIKPLGHQMLYSCRIPILRKHISYFVTYKVPSCAYNTAIPHPQSSLAELARNSVIQSGFEMEIKRHWLGQKWYLPGAAGNDINKVRLLCSRAHVYLADMTGVRRRMFRTSGLSTAARLCSRS